MKPSDSICDILPIQYPIIQAGMIWVSGAKLAAGAANAGILGLIGAGSMKPDLLLQHIRKAKTLTDRPFGINVPLLYPDAQEQIDLAVKEGIRIFFTSGGSPKKYTSYLKDKGCIVVHVTSSPELAIKCEKAGVDAVVAEGFEAGGHNGRDEITTMALVPQVVDAVSIPVIAAGGIADGRGIAAAVALGAAGVQIGTRFVATIESSAHPNFKNAVCKADGQATMLAMKKVVPVRMLKNPLFNRIAAAEARGADAEKLTGILGKGKAKAGMLDGDMLEGKIEIGEIAGLVNEIVSVRKLVESLCGEYIAAVAEMPTILR